MKIAAHLLIDDLITRTQANASAVSDLEKLTDKELNWKAANDSWSVLECIEHLNLYGDFYIPEIASRIQQADKSDKSKDFRSGFLGNYFAKSMLPQEHARKVKTFKDKDPSGSRLSRAVLQRFLEQQKQLLNLLNQAREVDLIKVKAAMSISSLIKFRLGDIFRVLVYHNERHIVQAAKVMAQMAKSEESLL